jgi:hypothetical protein
VTGDDDLRARLAAIDPARPDGVLGDVPDLSPAALQERIMQIVDRPAPTSDPREHGRRRARLLAAAAAVVVIVAAGIAGIVATTGGDPAPRTPAATNVALRTPPGGATSSCLRFDVELLRNMPVAFAGTATSVSKTAVTLDVDRWYRGGSADLVTVSVPDTQSSVALDGVEFVEGQRYLLTATDGVVNGCGFSGPESPELADAFAQAFGG